MQNKNKQTNKQKQITPDNTNLYMQKCMQEQKVTEERLVWFDKPPGIMTVLLSRDFLRRPSFFQPNPEVAPLCS